MASLDIGDILISEPFLLDHNFSRSVILLCDYSRDLGSIGFILNKSSGQMVNDVIDDFPEIDSEIFIGGPVQNYTIHYLHTIGLLLEGSHKVCDGVWWGGDFDKLKFLIKSGLVESKDIRFYAGYAGWDAGQLENEMKEKSWVHGKGFPNYVFNTNPQIMWSKAMSNQGKNYSVIAQMPDWNSLN